MLFHFEKFYIHASFSLRLNLRLFKNINRTVGCAIIDFLSAINRDRDETEDKNILQCPR